MNPELPTLEEKIRLNAELVVRQLSKSAGFELGFDEASVEWVDGFIERQRALDDFDDEMANGLVQPLGSFLGECLCREIGGEWRQLDEGLAVAFSDGNAAFPFNKVAKQFANGSDDSIHSFYSSARVLFGSA